jgi:hypothetical protein
VICFCWGGGGDVGTYLALIFSWLCRANCEVGGGGGGEGQRLVLTYQPTASIYVIMPASPQCHHAISAGSLETTKFTVDVNVLAYKVRTEFESQKEKSQFLFGHISILIED